MIGEIGYVGFREKSFILSPSLSGSFPVKTVKETAAIGT
jgi:hypothetical protein